MLRRMGNYRRYRRRAAVVVQVAVASTLMLGLTALVVDIGALYTAQTELQVSADAAALAAAGELAGSGDVQSAALTSADAYARMNPVMGMTPAVYPEDLEFGRAAANDDGSGFHFEPAADRLDAVRLTLRYLVTDVPGERPPIELPLSFAQIFGLHSRLLQATASAVLIPRDIAVVIDLSGSMSDDSELRHYKAYTGEEGDPRPGVEINLRDCWCALDGPGPDRPYVPGAENETQYAGDTGPVVGVMSNWGSQVVPETYNPVTDAGLWYIKKSTTCTVAAAQSSLQGRSYTADEISCLMSGSNDSSYTNQWVNRTCTILGLATWNSGRPGGRSGGDGDSKVEDAELVWASYPSYRGSWTWRDFVNYIGSSSSMTTTNSNLRYRFGLKTFTNFLLENKGSYSQTNILWQTPEQPLQAVKDAVQVMTDVIDDLDSLDHMSLEVFATTSRHEIDLTADLQSVPSQLYQRQAGHYNMTTNIGAALEQAITELTSARSRPAAAKVIVLMSDGKPNVDAYGNSVPEGSEAAVSYCVSKAQQAAGLNMRIYTVSVGGDADMDLMNTMASIGHGQHFHAEGTPEEYSFELEEIFRTLGGRRPVSLIE